MARKVREETPQGKPLRTTVVLYESLGVNLKHFASNHRMSDGKVIITALEKFLKEKGYRVDKIPKGSKPIYD